MREKILVTYATRCGSTEEVAREIGRVLAEGGADVDVLPVQQADDISAYTAVVAGSAIRGSRWLPEATRWLRRQRHALRRVPVAYFTVCMLLRDDTEENRRAVMRQLDPVLRLVPPVDVGLFAGVLDTRKLGRFTRFLMRLARTPEGDFRNWDVIRAWASGLRTTLASPAPVV